MIATLRPLTYDDLLEMPDDGQRREVLAGELIANPAPRRDHQEVAANLDWILQRFFRSSGLGRVYTHPVDIYLGRNDIVQPDLVVIRDSRLDIYRPEGVVAEPPDIVIEILSPSTRGIDLVRKMALYARTGIPEYWIADPERRMLIINTLQGEDYVSAELDPDGWLVSRVFPELRADGWLVSRVFPELRLDPAEVFTGLS